jgi:glycosyltransferase involved in cell wall biosynthesis
MRKYLSVIIPNYNGSATIGKCLDAVFASRNEAFEVIVVDDCSTDNSVEIIKQYPCTLIRLDRRAGAGAARNKGAESSKGDILFFTDADCLMRDNALSLANEAVAKHPDAVIGGTYTPLPCDADFYSAFQSLFIHYSETKKKEPDYVAGHAMIMDARLFRESGGFPQDLVPIPEDVAFSHRLRLNGIPLIMQPEIQVRHVFDFSFLKILRNAFSKSEYWTLYSLKNRDLLADSGTASVELKVNAFCWFASMLLALLSIVRKETVFLVPIPLIFCFVLYCSRNMLSLFSREKGLRYAVLGALFYVLIFPLPVGLGALAGLVRHALKRKNGAES